MSELPYTSESEERSEAQCCSRMGINECVAYKQAVFIVLEHHFLLQHHTSDTIDGCRNFVTIKFPDVLVALRTEIVALILMETEVEFRSMLYDRNIK